MQLLLVLRIYLLVKIVYLSCLIKEVRGDSYFLRMQTRSISSVPARVVPLS